jgi:hypothetical protein
MKSSLHTIFLSLTVVFASATFAQQQDNDSLVLHTVFIDQLKNGSPYKIKIWSGECYREHWLDIAISRNGADYHAVIRSSTQAKHANRKEKNTIRKKISAAEIDTLRAFEQQLSGCLALVYANLGNVYTSFDCQSLTEYTVTIGNKSKTFTDFDCRVGFLNRLRKIFSIAD